MAESPNFENLCFDSKTDIECAHELSPVDFVKHYLHRRKPVILKNALNWNRELWSFESLKSKYSDVAVEALRIDERGLVLHGEKSVQIARMNFHDFVDRMTDEKIYLQCRGDQLGRELGALASVPEYGMHIRGKLIKSVWIGSGSVSLGLHHDMQTDQLLCQVIGEKRIVMIPDDVKNTCSVYPRARRDQGFRSQVVDVDNPDLERFPNFIKARASVGVMSAGDILYIPDSWFHSLRTLEPGISIGFRYIHSALSSNCWLRNSAARTVSAFLPSLGPRAKA